MQLDRPLDFSAVYPNLGLCCCDSRSFALGLQEVINVVDVVADNSGKSFLSISLLMVEMGNQACFR